ncbi:hypothetical protein QTG54_009893 [Skeletonema marinoi]|uniref:Sulfotransferase domain-containing protein n=1 Tax=Skeletonema marinoi TaxID=267567 RepID=A0AAD9DB42_9STRA|nr:hypothetical protein QTG54_009893 [Skeletonema marinoi]
MAAAVAAANKSLWTKVSISIVSTLIGICLGAQFNILGSLLHINFEGRGDSYLDGGIPDYIAEQREKLIVDTTTTASNKPPSYLKWQDAPPPETPSNWTFIKPQYCNMCDTCHQKWLQSAPTSMKNTTEKIIVHYHLQHNAGTNFFALAHAFTPCATRACWQIHKHCLISYNEQVEAENIRSNYYQHGVQYVSYENMLPPRFPLPFVSESAREGLFFTTIMRDPMKRLITWLRQLQKYPSRATTKDVGTPPDFFWSEMEGNRGVYKRENLNVRWLSGTLDDVTPDHVNIAKCRLQLFDLVIVDTTYDAAVKEVICPLNNWQGLDEHGRCNGTQTPHHNAKKPDPLNETDSHFVGAWIERLRPSFELYDYARILSYLQLKNRGVKDIHELYEVPSYIETLSRFTNIQLNTPKESLVSLKNIDRFHPPKEFCDNLKKVWVSNADEVPYVNGIGTIGKGRIYTSHG